MKLPIGLMALWLFIVACAEEGEKQEKKNETKAGYFPVGDYLRGEIGSVDSLPVGIMKKVILNNKTDSAFIERAEFKRLANEFIGPDIEKNSLEKNFTENSFMDESTGYLSFTYQARNEEPTTRRIDVLAKPGATSAKVNSIYMEKEYLLHDTAINERLYWKANTSFRIIKEKKYKDRVPVIEQLLVIWDPAAY